MSASVRMLKPEQSGEAIRMRREQLNLSQEELAKAAGTTQQTVHRIEVGETRWSRALPCILDALGKIEREKAAPSPQSDIVTQAQHEIEVYRNSSGGIVVKMEGRRLRRGPGRRHPAGKRRRRRRGPAARQGGSAMNCPTCGCPVPVERTEAEEKAIREAVPYIVVKTVSGEQAIPDRSWSQAYREGR